MKTACLRAGKMAKCLRTLTLLAKDHIDSQMEAHDHLYISSK